MKQFLSILLIIMIIVVQVPGMALAEGTGGEAGFQRNPSLIISESQTYEAEPGDEFRVSIRVENVGNDWADNVIAVLDSHESGDVYVNGSSFYNVKEINSRRDHSFSFNIKVDESAEGKLYRLPIKINYNKLDYETLESIPMDPITGNINIRVKGSTNTPQIVVNRVDIMPSTLVKAGQAIAVGFDLENIGEASANDLKVTLEGLSNEGFTLARGVNYKTVQFLDRGKKTYVYFDLKSSKGLPSGSYELTLKMAYKDSKNQVKEEESTFFITVDSSAGGTSNLIFENLKYPSGPITQNKEVDINFDLRNQGQMDAKNIVVEATSSDPSGLVPKSVSIIKINNLKANESKKINFQFLTTRSSETRNYPIEITVNYVDELTPKGETYSINQYVGIFSQAPDEPGDGGEPGNQSVPKLIIDDYKFNPDLVKAGENFEMSLSFYNTNNTKAVKNIKIFLTSDSGSSAVNQADSGSVFTPVDSSNTFYIDSIAPKGRVEKKITMFTIPDALAKTHTITANFEYEDNSAEAYTATELIGVPVIQQSRLEVGEIGLYPEASVGQPMPVSLEFYNTGKVTLYNLMIKLEGDFDTEGGQYYVGNFESGGSNYFDGMIIPYEPGEMTGAVVFTYEDSTGETQELREEFSLSVMDMPPMDEYPGEFDDFPMEEEGSFFKSKWLWISLGAVVVIVGGIIFARKKKKKKEEEMSLDE